MENTMNKSRYYLLTTLLLTTSFIAHAYTIRMVNQTGEHLQVLFSYAACSGDDIRLAPGQSHEMGVGGCCTTLVKINGLSGKVLNQTAYYDHPRTGYGLGCTGYTFVIKRTATGQLIAETVG